MPTKLILIRHGSTEWNIKKRYSGYIDIDLSQAGRLQAKLLHNRLKLEDIHKVYSSDRKRALATATLVFKKLKIAKVPELREMRFGIFEGLTHKEILKRHAAIYKKWLKDPFAVKIPGGEHLKEFKKRVVGALRKIVSLNRNKTVAVVCHGGSISVFITHILKAGNFWKQIPESASISVVEFRNNRPKILSLNDTRHLN